MAQTDGSWLEADLDCEAPRRHYLHAALAWWRETTDVVILNSPWLKRSTGRAIRCVWICIHVFRWLFLILFMETALERVKKSSYMQMELLIMLFCFLRVLWVVLLTKRDGFWSGLLMCLGFLLSFKALGVFGPPAVGGDDSAYAFVTLCHCNVHPLGICLVVLLSTVRLCTDRHGICLEPWVFASAGLYTCISQILLLLAFTMDFSNRIRAVVSGVLYGGENSPTKSLVLASPVAGRSGRSFCWLAGLYNCIWLLLDTWISAGVGEIYLSRAVAYSLLAFLLLYEASSHLDGLHSDLILAYVCHMPPTLLAIDHLLCQSQWAPFNYPLAAFFHLMQVMATQTLIQAGCHPMLCACFTLPLYLHISWISMQFSAVSRNLLTGPFLCSVLICSHFVDYFKRMKAIQQGLSSSNENARSRERLAMSAMAMESLEPLGVRTSSGPKRIQASYVRGFLSSSKG